MDQLDRMLGHDRWATTQLLERCATLSEAQLDHAFDIGHHTLRETLDHMIYVIDFWAGWMSGRPVPHDRTTLQYERTLPALTNRHARFQAAFAEFARSATDAGRLDEQFIDHYSYPQSIGATILQLLYHNTQHRAEIRHMLERLGVTDLWDFDPQEWEHATGLVPNKAP